MKKTLITLLALAGVAVATETQYVEEGTAITFNSDLALPNAAADGGTYNGVSFTLNPISDTGRFDSDLADGLTLSPQLSLTSITICGRYKNNTSYAEGNMRLVVVDAQTNTVLGINNNGSLGYSTTTANATSPADVPVTFTFSDVVLSSSPINETTPKRYLAYFVLNSKIASVTVGETFATETYAFNVAAHGPGYTNSSALDWSLINANGAAASSNYVPYLTVTTTALPIPEPTAATLSLLALAGLAARRRRH